MERCKACGNDGYLEGPCNCITKKCERCNRFRKHNDKTSLCFVCENRLPPQILSGNNAVDKLIKKAKLSTKYTIEFIPYEQFTDITYLGKGGFSTVVLKNIDDSNDAKPGFLNEVENYFKCMNAKSSDGVNRLYGVTQDPNSKTIMIIMNFANNGDLHNYLSKNFKDLSSKIKGEILSQIIKGLEAIHDFVDLMEKCWDANPQKRPTAEYIRKCYLCATRKIYHRTFPTIENKSSVEQYNSKAIYTSRLLTDIVNSVLSIQSQPRSPIID
ncbi:18214_t:CDS:2, partial [Cetraspora pellucida]